MRAVLIRKAGQGNLPARSEYIAWSQVLEQADVQPWRLAELVEIGWIEPVVTEGHEHLFRLRDVYRVRKLERLCRDFELTSTAGSIIIDLLERIEFLEKKVEELTRLL